MRKEAERLVELFHEYGMEISDITPDLATEEIKRTKKFSLVKADEILLWLSEHQVTKWIAIDDSDLYYEEINRHQIKTDSNTGIQTVIKIIMKVGLQ